MNKKFLLLIFLSTVLLSPTGKVNSSNEFNTYTLGNGKPLYLDFSNYHTFSSSGSLPFAVLSDQNEIWFGISYNFTEGSLTKINLPSDITLNLSFNPIHGTFDTQGNIIIFLIEKYLNDNSSYLADILQYKGSNLIHRISIIIDSNSETQTIFNINDKIYLGYKNQSSYRISCYNVDNYDLKEVFDSNSIPEIRTDSDLLDMEFNSNEIFMSFWYGYGTNYSDNVPNVVLKQNNDYGFNVERKDFEPFGKSFFVSLSPEYYTIYGPKGGFLINRETNIVNPFKLGEDVISVKILSQIGFNQLFVMKMDHLEIYKIAKNNITLTLLTKENNFFQYRYFKQVRTYADNLAVGYFDNDTIVIVNGYYFDLLTKLGNTVESTSILLTPSNSSKEASSSIRSDLSSSTEFLFITTIPFSIGYAFLPIIIAIINRKRKNR